MTQEQIMWLVIGIVVVLLLIWLISSAVSRKKRAQAEQDRIEAARLREEAQARELELKEKENAARRAQLEADEAEVAAAKRRKDAEALNNDAEANRADLEDIHQKADALDPDTDTPASRREVREARAAAEQARAEEPTTTSSRPGAGLAAGAGLGAAAGAGAYAASNRDDSVRADESDISNDDDARVDAARDEAFRDDAQSDPDRYRANDVNPVYDTNHVDDVNSVDTTSTESSTEYQRASEPEAEEYREQREERRDSGLAAGAAAGAAGVAGVAGVAAASNRADNDNELADSTNYDSTRDDSNYDSNRYSDVESDRYSESYTDPSESPVAAYQQTSEQTVDQDVDSSSEDETFIGKYAAEVEPETAAPVAATTAIPVTNVDQNDQSDPLTEDPFADFDSRRDEDFDRASFSDEPQSQGQVRGVDDEDAWSRDVERNSYAADAFREEDEQNVASASESSLETNQGDPRVNLSQEDLHGGRVDSSVENSEVLSEGERQEIAADIEEDRVIGRYKFDDADGNGIDDEWDDAVGENPDQPRTLGEQLVAEAEEERTVLEEHGIDPDADNAREQLRRDEEGRTS